MPRKKRVTDGDGFKACIACGEPLFKNHHCSNLRSRRRDQVMSQDRGPRDDWPSEGDRLSEGFRMLEEDDYGD